MTFLSTHQQSSRHILNELQASRVI